MVELIEVGGTPIGGGWVVAQQVGDADPHARRDRRNRRVLAKAAGTAVMR